MCLLRKSPTFFFKLKLASVEDAFSSSVYLTLLYLFMIWLNRYFEGPKNYTACYHKSDNNVERENIFNYFCYYWLFYH